MTPSSDTGKPRLLITGTGRCGTMSWASAFGGEHEPARNLFSPLAAWYQGGSVTVEDVAANMKTRIEWPPAVASWQFAPLAPALDEIWQPLWLWTVRRPAPTVASMVAKGWYRPEDDDHLPFQIIHLVGWQERDDLTMWRYWTDGAGFRITAPLADDMGLPEWKQKSQVERCAWWWDWTARWLLSRLPPDRTRIVHVERPAPPLMLAEWTGLPCHPLPRHNASTVAPQLGKTDLRAVERITGRLEAVLYP